MARWQWHSQVTFRNEVSLLIGQVVVNMVNYIWQGLKKRAIMIWFYVKLVAANSKIASNLLHQSNNINVFKTLLSQEIKKKKKIYFKQPCILTSKSLQRPCAFFNKGRIFRKDRKRSGICNDYYYYKKDAWPFFFFFFKVELKQLNKTRHRGFENRLR